MPRRAIITGSDSGIGEASAVALAESGWDVGVTWHRDREGARGTAQRVEDAGRRTVVAHLDLAEPAAAAAVVDDMAAQLGGLDALVNNAGTGGGAPFLDLTLEQWTDTLTVDLTGAFVCGQAAARRMVADRHGGRIVNVTSVHEHIPLPGAAAYCAAKAGLGLLTKTMALELAPHGISVNAVAPGEIATAMTGQEDQEPRGKTRRWIPVGRPGDAREIAGWIRFLLEDGGSYATGESFVVDGGLMLVAAAANAEQH